MQPTNNKSLLHFIFGQMEKLGKGEISTSQAKAQASLAKEANNTLKYELERTKTLTDLDKYKRSSGAVIDLRNVEGIGFE